MKCFTLTGLVPITLCRHLIADNVGWFKNQDGSEGGKTVEDFVRAKGETVKRGSLFQTSGGDIEFVP
jgi:protein import protein ZIM17